jgi:hypothetical protein
MKRKTIDNDLPVGKMTKVDDFLPPPGELVIPKESIKVTLLLSKPSIEFFKRQARRHHTKYQRMIRQLVDKYALRYSQAA